MNFRKIAVPALFATTLGASFAASVHADDSSAPVQLGGQRAHDPVVSAQAAPHNERICYGGTVTLSSGDMTRIGLFPMVGYRISPKVTGGVEIGYEYMSSFGQSAHNYGGNIFGRYLLSPMLYAHAEYQTINSEVFGSSGSSREWMPALLLGGGVYRPTGNHTSVYMEVLFDALQYARSPEQGEPIVNFGVALGF